MDVVAGEFPHLIGPISFSLSQTPRSLTRLQFLDAMHTLPIFASFIWQNRVSPESPMEDIQLLISHF